MDWLHDSRHKKLDIKPDDLSSIPKVHIVEESQIPHAIVSSFYMLVSSCARASMHTHTQTLMCTYKHTYTHVHTHIH